MEDGLTVLAQPYVFNTLIKHAFSTDDSVRYIRTLSYLALDYLYYTVLNYVTDPLNSVSL